MKYISTFVVCLKKKLARSIVIRLTVLRICVWYRRPVCPIVFFRLHIRAPFTWSTCEIFGRTVCVIKNKIFPHFAFPKNRIKRSRRRPARKTVVAPQIQWYYGVPARLHFCTEETIFTRTVARKIARITCIPNGRVKHRDDIRCTRSPLITEHGLSNSAMSLARFRISIT